MEAHQEDKKKIQAKYQNIHVKSKIWNKYLFLLFKSKC